MPALPTADLAMSSYTRRLDRLEERRPDPFHDHPAHIPDWIRPWIDPLTIDDLEIVTHVMETLGLDHMDPDADVSSFPLPIRERYRELCESFDRFREGRR